jgi:hypothetical protein
MAATPTTATAVVHLIIRSAAVIGHHHQAQTRSSKGMSEGFLVQSVRTTKPPYLRTIRLSTVLRGLKPRHPARILATDR